MERKLGDLFPVVFKSITVDNGSEFADVAGMERSCLHKGKKRMTEKIHFARLPDTGRTY